MPSSLRGMVRLWQWVWDRYGARWSWVVYAASATLPLPIYLSWSFLIVAIEESSDYVEAAAATVVGLPVLAYVNTLPGLGRIRLVERWAAGHEVDRARALDATYAVTRGAVVRVVGCTGVWGGLLSVVVGAIAAASVHSFQEAALRPARLTIAADTGIGDSLPRSRPTFAAWSNVFVLASVFVFAVVGAMVAAVFGRGREEPLLFVVIGCALTLAFGVPFTVAAGFAPSLRPIRDLAEGTERVAAGDYSQRLPVVQDDDLGALAASFNRMQAGLAERQRLHAAFGTYVDPALAARLLEQGDDVFTGERRQVTVMFVDIRDFTPFAEANTAEDTVSRLNALFEIVVPAVVDAGGHVNKFLGDGALAVFGAPNDLADHADAAVRAAVLIHRLVAQRFGGELRIGIGINTGVVIAGTIGGGGKLEFTLIGDTVNVAARVEQLTKTTGDAILITQQCIDALASRPPGLIDRGFHVLKGKSAALQVFGLDQETDVPVDLTS
jgi:adenylate cyclase